MNQPDNLKKADNTGTNEENAGNRRNLLIKNHEKAAIYPAIFLVGMTGIVFEIGLTRIFSIALWHHFTFLSIAIALLGLGASGVFLSLNPQIIGENIYKSLYKFCWLFSLSIVLSFFIFTRLELDVRNLGGPANLIKFIIFYFFLALPFFFGGCVSSALMSRRSSLIQKLYFFDLAGAGLGCLLVAVLISKMGGQGVIITASVLSAGAAVLLAGLAPARERKILPGAVLYMAGLIFLIPSAEAIFPIPLPKDKALYFFLNNTGTKAEIKDTIWNSFSRVDTFAPIGKKTTWGISDKFPGEMPDQIGITIDGDGFTSIVAFDGDLEKVQYPHYTLNSMVHALNSGNNALIIGSGGGIDVLSALKLNASHVDAVEVNQAITYLVSGKYREFCGNLFGSDKVTLHTAEGRNFIKKSSDRYGLVYLPLVDSWAATYSGAYSLSENFLYTVEAFKDYYSHVKDDGFISISRWEKLAGGQPVQTYRLCSLAVAASGMDIKDSLIITAHGRLSNFILKKGVFTDKELVTVREFCRKNGFSILYMPGMECAFEDLLKKDKYMGFIEAFPLDISPVTDDRPFFYLTDRWRYIWVYALNSIRSKAPFPVVFTIVFIIIIFSIIFSIVFILLPLKMKDPGEAFRGSSLSYMAYFSLLGLSFMLVEVSLMTKFTLFLGHPGYSLSVVLFSILIFTGIGSYISSLFPKKPSELARTAIISLTATGIFYFFFLDRLFEGFLPLSSAHRMLISVILLAPLGLFMGMPFPLGLKSLSQVNKDMIPWAWGVNGCASVLGSISSLILAQAMGFWKTLIIALLLYLLAMTLLKNAEKNKTLSEPA